MRSLNPKMSVVGDKTYLSKGAPDGFNLVHFDDGKRQVILMRER